MMLPGLPTSKLALALLIALALSIGAADARADTQLGDWGHFLSYTPTFYLNNPKGEAFTLKVHRMQWGLNAWNKDSLEFRLTGPDGAIITDGAHALTDSAATVEVKDAKPGVYKLNATDNIWVWSSLAQSVAWTGVPGVHIRGHQDRVTDEATGKQRERKYYEKRGALVFSANVPRKWWFYVPANVTQFTCRAMRADTCMSQREDWGYFIITPRGQRIRALWGQPPHTKDYHQIQSVDVEVEPGTGGRFWCLEVRLGDSHDHSNINFSLDGVPPYLARSPEEYFDPETGKSPPVTIYDETPFIQSARIEEVMKERWPNLQHFSPCPSLGDPDGCEVLGNGTFALWNPEGRTLNFRIGTYLPRHSARNVSDEDWKDRAHVKITGGNGKVALDKDMLLKHVHNGQGSPTDAVETGKGVAKVEVTGDPERWLAFTYPATPLVWIGQDTQDGWKRFRHSVGTVRNWYFRVPAGTKEFSVRAACDYDTDVVHMEICAPDRVVDILYGNSGTKTVKVPEGLDGKIWFLRTDVGSATRIITAKGTETPDGREHRFMGLLLNVDLKGVPGYVAPTWEQWFDPANPVMPHGRGE